jgi:hypothetical protein
LIQTDIAPQGKSSALFAAALSRVGRKSRHRSQGETKSDNKLSAEIDQFTNTKDCDTAKQGSSEGTEA